MNIAVLLTCHNRRTKTELCLKSLREALDSYNNVNNDKINLAIYLTDDGCTDGTTESARSIFPNSNELHILQGDGSLFWAGGMRLAWKEALKNNAEWEYYLLLNDDTKLNSDCFTLLFETEKYSTDNYGKKGIISGITSSEEDPQKITYGGNVILNKFNGKSKRLGRNSKPQLVDLTNANILLVPIDVVGEIGIFHDGYKHGRADNDYAMLARRHKIPVLITAEACGTCEYDHGDPNEVKKKIINMTPKERSEYFHHPLHCNSDYLLFIRRNMPVRYPMSLLFRALLTYCPRLYFKINGARGV